MKSTSIESPEARSSSGLFFARIGAWLAHVRSVETDFWHRAKTRTVMLMAGAGSFLWGLSLLFEQRTGFLNQGFDVMRALMPAWAWALIFINHTCCVLYCRWAFETPWRMQLFTAYYGFLIWFVYVGATWMANGRYVIGTSFEVVMVFMLGWCLRRAGRKPVDEVRGDGH